MATYQINVNGENREVEAVPNTPLLWVLRDNLELTGTKFGCGMAQCVRARFTWMEILCGRALLRSLRWAQKK